jgi:hypothetical protein
MNQDLDLYIKMWITFYWCFLAPDADTSNPFSEFINQELSKSDRPELTSAGVVISGGTPSEHRFLP